MPQPRVDLLKSDMRGKLCLNIRSPESFRLASDRPSVARPTVPAFNGNVERHSVTQKVVASASEEYSTTLFRGKAKVHPTTGHEGPEGRYRYSSTLSLTSAPDGGWVVNATPRPLYPRERPGTRCTGGWVGLRTGLDMCGKSRPHRDSIPGS